MKWQTTDTIEESALSSQLKAALGLARSHPDALPDIPPWVVPVIKAGMGYDASIAKERQDYLVKTKPAWDTLGEKGQKRFGDDVEKFAKTGWDKKLPTIVKGLDASVAQVLTEFKWDAVYRNLNGDLPGLADSTAYREYYAEPNPVDVGPTLGTWGKNRVLHKVDDDGGYLDSWWVTDDHYVTFKRVVS